MPTACSASFAAPRSARAWPCCSPAACLDQRVCARQRHERGGLSRSPPAATCAVSPATSRTIGAGASATAAGAAGAVNMSSAICAMRAIPSSACAHRPPRRAWPPSRRDPPARRAELLHERCHRLFVRLREIRSRTIHAVHVRAKSSASSSRLESGRRAVREVDRQIVGRGADRLHLRPVAGILVPVVLVLIPLVERRPPSTISVSAFARSGPIVSRIAAFSASFATVYACFTRPSVMSAISGISDLVRPRCGRGS